MSIVEILSRAGAESGKNFLVIGGYAVNAHGYSRVTVDLDILANKADREFWKEVMLKNGYKVYSEQPNFSQFSPTTKSQQAVDFMLVNEKTFSNMHAEAVEGTLAKVKIKYPSLLHLIALKLHVIKQAMPHRELRDRVDVVELAQMNGIDPMPTILNNYAKNSETPKLMRQSSKQADKMGTSKTDLDLEFPDAPDFISRPPRMTPDQMYVLNQPMVEAFNSRPDAEEERLRTKCHVEFVL